MISVIICSVNNALLDVVSKNIEQTIGVEFELIAIDNSNKNDGICIVYNKAGALAKYPFVCFVHEDVLFEVPGWGQKVIEHFKDENIGLLGLAGGDTKSVLPTSWSTSYYANEINIVQHNWTGKINSNKEAHLKTIEEKVKKVIAVDGVFMCIRKSLLSMYQFDERLLPGFHGYDVDLSLQMHGHYDVVVVNDIVMHHFSEGVKNQAWLNSAFAISDKWKTLLPVSVYPLSFQQFREHHWKATQVFLTHLFMLNYSIGAIIKFLLRYSFGKYFHYRRFLSMCKFIVLAAKERKKQRGDSNVLLKTVLNYS